MEAGLPTIVQALLRPEAYPHPADDLRLHETHISWVFLAGPFAYKIRKPVNLGFVDFTSAAARLEDCINEVRLNRRLCPDLYLGVVQVPARDGQYRIGEKIPLDSQVQADDLGEPAVMMRRLPEDGMLPELLARNSVTPALMEQIAQQLATFHETAATGPGVDEYGSLTTITTNWEENFAQTALFVGRTLSQATYSQIRQFVLRFLAEQRTLLERRVSDGRIRDGHGDLHAGSICLDGDRVHLFDCLEFAPRFRCADVAAEVAFLAMDLDRYGRADLGTAFVDAYVRISNDRELLRLLDFYRCYRAYVRGKVRSLRLSDPALTEAERTAAEADARAYFTLAAGYAGETSPVEKVASLGGSVG